MLKAIRAAEAIFAQPKSSQDRFNSINMDYYVKAGEGLGQ
jgi:anthranilate synthase component 1